MLAFKKKKQLVFQIRIRSMKQNVYNLFPLEKQYLQNIDISFSEWNIFTYLYDLITCLGYE